MPQQVTVVVSWNANPAGDNVTAYTLKRGIVSGLYTVSIPAGLALTASDVITVSRTYFWAVTAQNAIGISPPSSEVSEFVNVPVPAPPGPMRMVVG